MTAIWGESAEADRHHSEGRAMLLAGGKAGIERWIAAAMTAGPPGGSTDPLSRLAAYLAPHPHHLGYASRLARGRISGAAGGRGRSRNWSTCG